MDIDTHNTLPVGGGYEFAPPTALPLRSGASMAPMDGLLDRPLFMDHAWARRLFSSLGRQLQISSLVDDQGAIELGAKLRTRAVAGTAGGEAYRPYRLENGIAVVPVAGTLRHRFPFLNAYVSGYPAIVRMVELAVEDPEVDGILLDINSAGGEVSGCFDAADRLRALGAEKPIAALSNDMNLSAAMCLASSAQRRYITQTGEAGSVGVVLAHTSFEEMDKKFGLQTTLIYSGEHKVDGNPYQNLPADVFERFQEQVHDLRQEFAALLSSAMSLALDDVLATEAAVYRGQAAVDVGFADELVNSHDAIAAFSNYLSSQGRATITGATMSTMKDTAGTDAGTGAPTAGADEQQQLETQPLAETALAPADAVFMTCDDERARIKGILEHANAKGREKQASHLAFNTSLSVEAAAEILGAGAVEQAPVADDPGRALENAMRAHSGGSVTAGGDDPATGDGNDAARMAGLFQQYTGRGK